MNFDPQDPFPLWAASASDPATYARAQAHSEAVDAWLGLRIPEIEAGLARLPGHEAWVGLPPRALQTPYTELREILARLAPGAGQTVVDLGAAYGRLALVIGRHHPDVAFRGYELVAERVREAERCGVRGLACRDLGAPGFAMPEADFYFIYDFGTAVAIDRALEALRGIASRRPVTVVGRGRAARDRIERGHPWLSQVVSPSHHGHYSIYRSAP